MGNAGFSPFHFFPVGVACLIKGRSQRKDWGDEHQEGLRESRSGGAQDGDLEGEWDEVSRVISQGQDGWWGGLRWLRSQCEERPTGGLRCFGVGVIV